MGDLIGVTLTGEYAFPKGVGFVADVEVGFNENIINLVTTNSPISHIMSIILIYHTAEHYLKHCNAALLQYVATFPT